MLPDRIVVVVVVVVAFSAAAAIVVVVAVVAVVVVAAVVVEHVVASFDDVVPSKNVVDDAVTVDCARPSVVVSLTVVNLDYFAELCFDDVEPSDGASHFVPRSRVSKSRQVEEDESSVRVILFQCREQNCGYFEKEVN